MTDKPGIQGTCDDKLRNLKAKFDELVRTNQEVGCAVAVYLDGKLVVDLWGGWADPDTKAPWQRDTIVSTFSVTKAMVSTMGHMLVDRGTIDLDQPVAKYWPAFGQNGKESVLVRHLLDHRCAVSYVDRALKPGDL